MHPARSERQLLCAIAAEVGPDAPTNCGEWNVRELVAHLVTRDRRPDAGPGLAGRGAAGRWTAKIEARKAEEPFEKLIEQLRSGPPAWWAGRWLPRIDLHEYFVHHEDIRRANGHGPRTDIPELDDAIWEALAMWGKILTRKTGMSVKLVTPSGDERMVSAGGPAVTLHGRPTELMLRLFNRDAEVTLDGEVEMFKAAVIGL